MKGKKLTIYICFTVLMIALSFLMYYGFSEGEKTAIQNISFSFIVIAECIFFAMIYFSTNEKNDTFTRAGIVSTSLIYMVIALIINIFLKVIFNQIRILVTINIVALLIFIGLILLMFLFKKEKN